jgi:exonuclease SbcD
MRFLHTSDWHLGRLFHNVHLTDDQAHVLAQFVELVRESEVDAVIIAGDIYDRAVPPAAAVELLDDVLSQLVLELKVPTIVIAGNHDGPERLGFGARLLKERGLYIAGTLPQGLARITLEDAHGPVHVVPIPYAVPEVVREWAKDEEVRGHQAAMQALITHARKGLPKGERQIAVAHAFVAGGEECESERALSVGGSGQISTSLFEGFDYVALGHLHRPQNVGSEKVRYSGSLLKYSFSELAHSKSVSLVEMDKQGRVEVTELPLTPRHDLRSVTGTLEEVLSAAGDDPRKEDYLLAVLEDDEVLLNPMAKLRTVYPNVLHIERPHFGAATMGASTQGDHRKLSTLDLFGSFWKNAGKDALDEPRLKVLAEIIKESEKDRK